MKNFLHTSLTDDDASVNDVYLDAEHSSAADDTTDRDGDNVIHVSYHPRAIGLEGDFRACFLTRQGIKKLADSGANICLTNDLRLLLHIRDIAPISIGVAIDGDPAAAPQEMTCTQMGFLPLPLLDGSVHLQPCY